MVIRSSSQKSVGIDGEEEYVLNDLVDLLESAGPGCQVGLFRRFRFCRTRTFDGSAFLEQGQERVVHFVNLY